MFCLIFLICLKPFKPFKTIFPQYCTFGISSSFYSKTIHWPACPCFPSQLHLFIQWCQQLRSPWHQCSPRLGARWTVCWGCCSRTSAGREFKRPPRGTVPPARSQWWDRQVIKMIHHSVAFHLIVLAYSPLLWEHDRLDFCFLSVNVFFGLLGASHTATSDN